MQKARKLYSLPVPSSGLDQSWLTEMLNRVNVLPEALVLTQAANESAWGHRASPLKRITISDTGVTPRAVALFRYNVTKVALMKSPHSLQAKNPYTVTS